VPVFLSNGRMCFLKLDPKYQVGWSIRGLGARILKAKIGQQLGLKAKGGERPWGVGVWREEPLGNFQQARGQNWHVTPWVSKGKRYVLLKTGKDLRAKALLYRVPQDALRSGLGEEGGEVFSREKRYRSEQSPKRAGHNVLGAANHW